MFTNVIIDYDKYPLSDKVLLPQEVLESLLKSGKDDLFHSSKPLLFVLSVLHHKTKKLLCTSVVGVREFSLEDTDSIVLPWSVAYKLELCTKFSVEEIYIEYKLFNEVPNGTSVSLEPLGEILWENLLKSPSNYTEDIVDNLFPPKFTKDDFFLKSFLEARLNNSITCAVLNDYLLMSTEANGAPSSRIYKFKIHDLKPAEIVCIVNTDLELDIVRSVKVPVDENGNNIGEGLPINESADSCERAVEHIEVGEAISVSTSDNKIFKLESSHNLELQILENDLSESFQLLISNSDTVNTDSFLLSTLSSFSHTLNGDKNTDNRIDLPEQDSLYILPHFFSTPKLESYTFMVNDKSSETKQRIVSPDEVCCPHCQVIISKSAYVLHELHCLRNTKFCDTCKKKYLNLRTIPDKHWHCTEEHSTIFGGETTDSREIHERFYHECVSCSACKSNFKNRITLAIHRQSECPYAKQYCQFCHLLVYRGESTVESRYYGLSAHELACGVKTVECYKCGKAVKKLELAHHLEMHQLERKTRGRAQNFKLCTNRNCCRAIPSRITTNPYGFCDTCFGPFYSTDDTKNSNRFRMKLERKYVIQLSRGCGFTFCKNPECKSSGLTTFNTMADILGRVQRDLLPNEGTTEFSFWLCVDESTTRRKMLADYYCEAYPVKYDKTWVFNAVYQPAVRDIDTLDNWLAENAVSKAEI